MSQADVETSKVTPLRPTDRVKQPSANAQRQKRHRDKKRTTVTPSTVTPSVTPTVAEPSVTIVPPAPVTVPAATDRNAVTPPVPRGSIGRYVAAGLLGVVGIGFSAIGMIETASYSLTVGGLLFCAKAIGADVLTLTMPATIGTLWRKRSPAVILAGVLWCAGIVVTVENLAGYVGEHVEQ